MPFISFAQNFEDVMLWRALKDVDRGFYIDVGAWSALQDSVTRAFYERGWNGVNVEPSPAYHDELVQHRARDINLRQALSDVPGRAMMYFVSNPGLSSLNETIARGYEVFGWTSTPAEVEVTTLSALWAAHVPAGQDVHFLKVDVEGLEEAVLRGNDWTQNRPWIVVVEATKPMSQEESFQSWDPILTGADYVLAYADGLNRFYVAAERRYLADAFRYPPNVFDDMIRLREQVAEAQVAAAEFASAQLETRLQVAEAQVAAGEKLLRYTTESCGEMIRQNSYLKDRSAWERLFFHTDGRPIKLLRRLMFHNNGKPRGVFRKYILGKPRGAFHYWMTSPSYLALPRAVQPPTQPEGGGVGQSVWRNLIDVDSPNESDLDALMERIRSEVAAAKHGAGT